MALSWVNGKLIAEGLPAVPVLDRGFLYGEGCFETVRIHRGAPFRLGAHLQRLEAGLQTLGLEPPEYLGKAREGIRALVEAQGIAGGLIRISATPPNRNPKFPGTVAITTRPLPTPPKVVSLLVAQSVQRLPGPLSSCKGTSRVVEALALREAERSGAFDAILLNPQGNVVETTARNIFVVFGRTLRTPTPSEGALRGVTRAVVMELAQRSGIEVEEVAMPLGAMFEGREVLLTGSGVGVLGVAAIDGRSFKPVPGPVTEELLEAYHQTLDRESRW